MTGGWLTNKKTRKPFPTGPGQNIDALEQQSDEVEGEVVPRESEAYICAGCGKSFVGQAYEIDGQIVCPECNRLDNRLQRQEERKAEREGDQTGVEMPTGDEEPESEGKGTGWWGGGINP